MMVDNSEPTLLLSPLFEATSNNIVPQEATHSCTRISQKLTRKLHVTAISNIVAGIVTIGLDIGLLANSAIRELYQ